MKFFIAVFLSSLITLPAWDNVNNSISVEIVNQPSKAWSFASVNVYNWDGAISVNGHIVGHRRFRLPKGHVDIAAYSPEGELIIATTTNYNPRKLRYRAANKWKVRFSTNIAEILPPNSTIKIAFHSNKSSADSNKRVSGIPGAIQ